MSANRFLETAMISTRYRPVLGVVAAFALTPSAQAHHMMGGRMPADFSDGLLSGIGHPVIGPDHLAAVLAVGVLAALSRRTLILCALFFASTLAGVAAHVSRVNLPGSVAWGFAVVSAVLALWAIQDAAGRTKLVSALFIVAGALHGYAYGESIVGAQPGPLAAYLIGLTLIQASLAIGAGLLTRALTRKDLLLVRPAMLTGAAALVAANVAVVLLNTIA